MGNTMSRIFEGLNEEQKRAVSATVGPVLVVAGPGTGKTLTLVRRIAHLVDRGVAPEEIAAITFTNRAAREMRERTDAFLGDRASGIFIGTFHLLGLKLIRESRREPFTVCDRAGQVDILHGLMGDRRGAERMVERLSRIKGLSEEADPAEREIWEAYEDVLARRAVYDFDDLILVPLRVLQDDPAQGAKRTAFGYLMVDEYQDINPAQYRLMRRLAGERRNLCVVGDADQAIYAFRGADIGNFLDFEHDFAGAERIILTRNYRSSKAILDASLGVIKHNTRRIDYKLDAIKDRGAKVTVIGASDEREEAAMIVGEIEEMMGGTSHYGLMKGETARDFAELSHGFRDFAVIMRTNAQVADMERSLAESGIPYQVVRGKSALRAKEMADILGQWIEKGRQILSPGNWQARSRRSPALRRTNGRSSISSPMRTALCRPKRCSPGL